MSQLEEAFAFNILKHDGFIVLFHPHTPGRYPEPFTNSFSLAISFEWWGWNGGSRTSVFPGSLWAKSLTCWLFIAKNGVPESYGPLLKKTNAYPKINGWRITFPLEVVPFFGTPRYHWSNKTTEQHERNPWMTWTMKYRLVSFSGILMSWPILVFIYTRWDPTIVRYKWSYNPYKRPKKNRFAWGYN